MAKAIIEDAAKTVIKRLGKSRQLHAIIPVFDSSGQLIKQVVKPLMVELEFKDVMQIIVGSTILAIPMAFTEETWQLGERLPLLNISILSLLSLSFIALFVYVNFYHNYLKGYVFEYIKRVLTIYIISLLVVAGLMTVIQQCPWDTDALLAIKRVILVAFPASMSAVATDAMK